MARPDSENGWRPPWVGQDQLNWVKIPGAEHVSLQFMKGWPTSVMRAYAADYHAYIEPLRDADSASYTATNSVSTSNHLNGTAMDLNWQSHPFQVDYAGFDSAKIARMRELLAFYKFEGLQIMFWAQDWDSPKDAMHHQMGYGTWNNPIVGRFIEQRIRPDGFSTYKRGNTVPANRILDILARATGVSLVKASEILVGVQDGLRNSQCTNVNRIAMWLAQNGHESANFNYTEEIASGAAYEGRADLGNTQPGDGVRFKGRSWIQITGRHNYTKLSAWAYDKGIVDSPAFFVDAPTKLAQVQYAGLGPAWYWTVARPDINALSDRRDLDTVTRRINGGTNGIDDRRNRYNRALALGDELLELINNTPTPGGDDMAQVPQDQWDRVYQEITKRFPSRSPLRHLGEGPVETLAGFVLNVDGSQHVEIVTRLAKYGDPEALALLQEVAGADPKRYPDRQHDAKLAQAILAEVLEPAANQAVQDVVAARLSADVPQQTWTFEPSTPVSASSTTGQIIGEAYDALEKLQESGVLNNSGSAPLVAALIGVLATKTEGA